MIGLHRFRKLTNIDSNLNPNQKNPSQATTFNWEWKCIIHDKSKPSILKTENVVTQALSNLEHAIRDTTQTATKNHNTTRWCYGPFTSGKSECTSTQNKFWVSKENMTYSKHQQCQTNLVVSPNILPHNNVTRIIAEEHAHFKYLEKKQR